MKYAESLTHGMYRTETSYLGDDLMGAFLWWQSYSDKVAEAMKESFGLTQSKADLKRIVEGIYPIYEALVLEGKAPFQSGLDARTGIAADVSIQSGFSVETVLQVLSTIEYLAQRGEIKAEVWNPKLRKPGAIESAAGAIWREGIAAPVTSAFNKLLVTGAVVGLIYLLGRTYIFEKARV